VSCRVTHSLNSPYLLYLYTHNTVCGLVIWRKDVNIDGQLKQISIKEGEEPADVIFQQTLEWDINRQGRNSILEAAKQDGVPMTRGDALVYQRNIVFEDGNNSTTSHDNSTTTTSPVVAPKQLQVFDKDGQEPVDVVWAFAAQHNLTNDIMWDHLWESLSPDICTKLLLCHRSQPAIWSKPIALDNSNGQNNGNDNVIGTVEILKDVEPIDAIDTFCQQYRLPTHYRDMILKEACEQEHVSCNRLLPLIHEQRIVDENGTLIGNVEIFEHEEAADAVYRFVKDHQDTEHAAKLDIVQLKNHFFQNVCSTSTNDKQSRMKCTRSHAVIANLTIHDVDGKYLGQLVLDDTREPVDLIYNWCQERGIGDGFAQSLMKNVCDKKKNDYQAAMTSTSTSSNTSNNMIHCNHAAPLIYGPQRISDPNEDNIGILQVEMWQEPIDAIYKFFAKHDLFTKGWDMRHVLDQICKYSGLQDKCQRREAVKFHDAAFQMIGGGSHTGTIGRNGDIVSVSDGTKAMVDVGPFVVWEHEEVIDKLYEVRQEYNLTLEAQMVAFRQICSSKEIICGRTEAIVYRRSGINKFDYAKYGNETCPRHVAGWQHLSFLSRLEHGKELAEYLKEDHVKEVCVVR
jgi:hypothetical protein